MSQDQNQNKSNTEEVDLIVFFDYLGGVFNKLLGVIKGVFLSIFSSVIYLFRVFFQNWKIVLGVMLIAIALGVVAEKYNKTVYSTSMLVEPFYESKYQLITNVEYFNALIANEDTETLKNIFDTEETVLESLVGFKIVPGPETENQRRVQYEMFLEDIDSVRALDYPFEEFVKNRSIYSGKLYDITAFSTKSDIFPMLEKGIKSSFTNAFSEKSQKRRKELLAIQKSNLEDQLMQIDSLQNIYIDVLQEDSKKTKRNISLGGEISFAAEKQKTKEYELFLQEQNIRDQLKAIEEQKIQEEDFYDVISGFQKVGNKVKPWTEKYKIIFPVVAFLLLIISFLASKFIQYTLNYEK